MNKPYTVILLRPDYLADSSAPADTYMTHVWAADPQGAVISAQKMVAKVDGMLDDIAEGSASLDDYYPIATILGHHHSVY